MSGYQFTDHVCRECFGRVLMRRRKHTPDLYLCADCALNSEGEHPSVICACGAQLRTGESAGMHCERNPEHKAGRNPAAVAVYDGQPVLIAQAVCESIDTAHIKARDKRQLALL